MYSLWEKIGFCVHAATGTLNAPNRTHAQADGKSKNFAVHFLWSTRWKVLVADAAWKGLPSYQTADAGRSPGQKLWGVKVEIFFHGA